MEDLLYMLVGMAMVYVMAHFYYLQFTTTWNTRNSYGRFLTVAGGVIIATVTFT